MVRCVLLNSSPDPFHKRKPGDMWFCTWYFDPENPEDRKYRLEHDFLSIYYRNEYYKTRAPIAVVCPDRSVWIVDQKSSNGEGWQVLGEAPIITCTPSIVVPGYHGFLRDGIFTEDLEGRKYET
jgi:hypothetical protein